MAYSLSLYESTLLVILKRLIDGSLKLNDMTNKLPYDIVADINKYLSLKSNDRFIAAILDERFSLADYFLNDVEDQDEMMNVALEEAMFSEKSNIIDYVVNKSANNFNLDWNYGLVGAIRINNIDLINYSINMGAHDFNAGLSIAVETNNPDLIYFLIELGANDWNLGLRTSVEMNNRDLIDFFIEKGADDWDSGLKIAVQNDNIDLILYFIELGATIDENLGDELLLKFIQLDDLETIKILASNFVMTGIIRSLQFAWDNQRFDILKIILDTVGMDFSDFYSIRKERMIYECFMSSGLHKFLDRVKPQTKSGKDLSYFFPILFTGWALLDTFKLMTELYMKQNNLIHTLDEFILDIFGSNPAVSVYLRSDRQLSDIPNTKKMSTLDAIRKNYPTLDLNNINDMSDLAEKLVRFNCVRPHQSQLIPNYNESSRKSNNKRELYTEWIIMKLLVSDYK